MPFWGLRYPDAKTSVCASPPGGNKINPLRGIKTCSFDGSCSPGLHCPRPPGDNGENPLWGIEAPPSKLHALGHFGRRDNEINPLRGIDLTPCPLSLRGLGERSAPFGGETLK